MCVTYLEYNNTQWILLTTKKQFVKYFDFYLFAFYISSDCNVQILRPVKLLVVVPNFFNGGTLSKVGQLASCLRGVRAVAWVQFLDHGKVDDVGGFVLNTLWKRVKILIKWPFPKQTKCVSSILMLFYYMRCWIPRPVRLY